MSVAVALAGVVGVVASAWALQAEALPQPRPAARVAADASVWFHEYRLAVDIFHFEHRTLKGACVSGWTKVRNGQARASVISFTGGPILRLRSRRVSVVAARRRRRFPPGRLAGDAGCTRMLGQMLETAAQNGGRLSIERSYAANQPAVAVELVRSREERLTLYVEPRTNRPLVAFVNLDGRKITARIYLQRVSRRVLTRFEILHAVIPEPKR